MRGIYFFIIICFITVRIESQSSNSNINILLKDSLWSKRDIYDASHFLMVPLHYNFKNKKNSKPFDHFFELFLKNKKGYFINNNNLQKLQFCYFLSQYLKLKVLYESEVEIEDIRVYLSFLTTEIDNYWNNYKLTSWKDHNVSRYVFRGLKDRINWKLNTLELDDTYYNRVITDEEKFFLAIAADLRHIISDTNYDIKTINQLKTIEDVSLRIFKERASLDREGFVFQKGFWSRHRDYRFAGCETLDCIKMGPHKIENISEDTSHSFRMPLILNSLKDGSSKIDDKGFYDSLIKGLAHQLKNKVVVQMDNSDCFALTNYLDGTNGYFRFGYSTHKNTGYGPNELGETFKLGWWIFLNDDEIKELYKQVYSNLNNKKPCEFKYKDKTERKRHPIFQNRFDNELYKDITLMASKLNFK